MSERRSKKVYEVKENESIDACLDRIKRDGYIPIRRIEKPIFHENVEGSETIYVPVKKQIIFEVKKVD